MPKKRFGQHFLQSPDIIDQCLGHLQPSAHDHFVEIGPGQGALTFALLNRHIARLDAIEIENDVLAFLRERGAAFKALHIHAADATQFDLKSIPSDGKSMRLIGNLPYNIGSVLLFHCLSFMHLFQDMHFMLQKEVVDRLVAPPGSKTYGRLSVMTQYYCQVEPLFDVPPSAFWPQPKVMSAVFRLTPHPSSLDPSRCIEKNKLFAKIVKQAFSQRRKMIGNSLATLISTDELNQLNIDPKQRPEQLTQQAFITLRDYLAKTQHHLVNSG